MLFRKSPRSISQLFALALCVLTPLDLAAQEKDIFAGEQQKTESIAPQEHEFLRVEEAYQVFPEHHESSIIFQWAIQPGYYLYQHQFAVHARNGSEQETLPLTFQDGKEKYDEFFDKDLVVYYTSTEVSAPKPTLAAPYELKISSQGCADAGLCYPPRHQYFSVDADGSMTEVAASTFSTSSPSPADGVAPPVKASPEEAPFLPLVLLGAILGGLILNLMPCVFPVLSLKALSFASARMNPHKQHLHGWAYTAGVVGSFLLAASLILAARGAGESLGWGFQLQHPGFVAFMAYLFFIMGLSLSGLVHFGTSWMGAGQSLTTGDGLKSSFFTGVLAALVASPCTAPFMATALGFALTQPAYVALTIFAALGFGMALPFIMLSYMPKLASYLPAPGAWMDTLKQVLAFPLYLTAVWLLWVLGNQTSSSGAMAVLAGGVLIAFGLWLTQQRVESFNGKVFSRGLATLSLLGAAYIGLTSANFREQDAGMWEAYSPERLAALRQENTPVFIDLTADWCITCKFNERVALNTQEVARFAAVNDIAMLQGDWTNSDPIISALLDQFGRSGVPLYLMYAADQQREVEVLPQILTQDMVLKAMERALR